MLTPGHAACGLLRSGHQKDSRVLAPEAGPLPSVTDLRYTGCRKWVNSAPCRPSTFQRRILSLQDMVRSRSPSRMPSHVGTMSLDSTGIVPSPARELGQAPGPERRVHAPDSGRRPLTPSLFTHPTAPTVCGALCLVLGNHSEQNK